MWKSAGKGSLEEIGPNFPWHNICIQFAQPETRTDSVSETRMILLLGASGFIGRTFAGELRRRGHSFIPLTRRAFDYSRFDFLFDYLRTMRPIFLINAAGYFGSGADAPGAGEREKMMAANAILPQMIARICSLTKTPWAHVSSGDIFSGGKIVERETERVEPDLGRAGLREIFEKDPGMFRGFTEVDEPNFTFRNSPCNFFSGAKALAEEAIREIGQSYIWRVRMPFNERDEPCNLLVRLPQQPVIYDHINSISHVNDFVKAALDLWESRAPYGTYNITNPGFITNRQLAEGLQRAAKSVRLKLRPPEEDPARYGTAAPNSNCILDASKLLKTGVRLRPASDALKDALEKLRLASAPARGPTAPPLQPPSTGPATNPPVSGA